MHAPVSANRPAITGYIVTAVPSDGSPPLQTTASRNTAVLSGLQEGTTYSVEVVAVNSVGSSNPATTVIYFSGMLALCTDMHNVCVWVGS